MNSLKASTYLRNQTKINEMQRQDKLSTCKKWWRKCILHSNGPLNLFSICWGLTLRGNFFSVEFEIVGKQVVVVVMMVELQDLSPWNHHIMFAQYPKANAYDISRFCNWKTNKNLFIFIVLDDYSHFIWHTWHNRPIGQFFSFLRDRVNTHNI